jgi:hypothetical protein
MHLPFMKKQTRRILIMTACASLMASSLTIQAQTEVPKAEPVKAEPVETAAVSPTKEQYTAVRKKAMEDPSVKDAMDSAKKAQQEANLKLFKKMREMDPTLGAMLDKEEAKNKPKEAKAKTAAATPVEKKKDPAAATAPKPDKAGTKKAAKAGAKDSPPAAPVPVAKPVS